MKKILIFTFVVLMCLTSCEYSLLKTYKVHVSIPQHPWEDESLKLWYTLKWNNNDKIETLYIDSETREIDIVIPQNCTVYVCAYPLGEMLPFGCAITPTHRRKEVLLNQEEGYVAHLLINSDLEAAVHVNFEELINQIEEKTFDFRLVDDSTLVSDVTNGCLAKDSIEIKNKVEVPEIAIPNGVWICEWEKESSLVVTGNKTPVLELAPGVTRYYCKGLDREFRVVVESNGSVFSFIKIWNDRL